jgi:hypothetical protein
MDDALAGFGAARMTLLWVLVGVLFLLVLWFVLGVRRMRARATPIAQDDPWLQHAVQCARDNTSEMLRLVAEGMRVAAKFPLRNGRGEVEHVWGAIQRTIGDGLEVIVMTPLFVGPTPEGPVHVELAELEDWQTFLPDGSIRGGYTTQAQLAVCRREGFSIPKALLQQEPCFADRIEFPLVAENP